MFSISRNGRRHVELTTKRSSAARKSVNSALASGENAKAEAWGGLHSQVRYFKRSGYADGVP